MPSLKCCRQDSIFDANGNEILPLEVGALSGMLARLVWRLAAVKMKKKKKAREEGPFSEALAAVTKRNAEAEGQRQMEAFRLQDTDSTDTMEEEKGIGKMWEQSPWRKMTQKVPKDEQLLVSSSSSYSEAEREKGTLHFHHCPVHHRSAPFLLVFACSRGSAFASEAQLPLESSSEVPAQLQQQLPAPFASASSPLLLRAWLILRLFF